jgi:hypothetical protein
MDCQNRENGEQANMGRYMRKGGEKKEILQLGKSWSNAAPRWCCCVIFLAGKSTTAYIKLIIAILS